MSLQVDLDKLLLQQCNFSLLSCVCGGELCNHLPLDCSRWNNFLWSCSRSRRGSGSGSRNCGDGRETCFKFLDLRKKDFDFFGLLNNESSEFVNTFV